MTPALAQVPRLVTETTAHRALQHGHVTTEQRTVVRTVQDTFGPLDWVRYLKAIKHPSQARRRRVPIVLLLLASLGCLIGSGVLLLASLNSPSPPIGESNFYTDGHAFVAFFALLLAAVSFVVAAVSIAHPSGADVALAAIWGGFAAQDARHHHWGRAGLDAVWAGQALYRVHGRVQSEQEAKQQDAVYWATLETYAPLEEKWEAAEWYFHAYQAQTGRTLPSYAEVVARLESHPQVW